MFCQNGSQNHLVFQSVFKHFKTHINNNMVMAWKPKGFSNVSFVTPATSDNILNLRFDYFNNPKFPVEFDGSCFKTDKLTFALN